jgi:hypothetical protein
MLLLLALARKYLKSHRLISVIYHAILFPLVYALMGNEERQRWELLFDYLKF